MAFAGLRGTGDWGTDERPKNFREFILWNNPNGQAPLTALMAKMKDQSTNDPEFAWWEERLTPVELVTAADLAAASTTVTVASGALNLVAGDVILFEKAQAATYDNEVGVVSSVTNDTTFVIKRGQANTTPAGFASGGHLLRIGSAFEEGSSSPGSSTRNPTKFRNYCQIFKKKAEITATAELTYARTGDAWNNDKKRKAFDLSVDMEYAFMFGQPYELASGPANGKPVRYTGGIRSFLTTNVKVFATTPTEDAFIDFMGQIYDFEAGGAGDERIVFCGRQFLTNLNKIARNSSSSRINYNGVMKGTYGMNIQQWDFPYGSVGLKIHPLMTQNSQLNTAAFIINPSGLTYRYMRDVKFKDHIEANDDDTHAGMWLAEVGLELHYESSFGYIGNFVI